MNWLRVAQGSLAIAGHSQMMWLAVSFLKAQPASAIVALRHSHHVVCEITMLSSGSFCSAEESIQSFFSKSTLCDPIGTLFPLGEQYFEVELVILAERLMSYKRPFRTPFGEYPSSLGNITLHWFLLQNGFSIVLKNEGFKWHDKTCKTLKNFG